MSYVATAYVRNLRDPRLTLQHKAVLMMLADRHQMLGKTDWPSLLELAEECSIKKSWLCDLLADVIHWKLLIRSPGGGRKRKTSYELMGIPAPFKQSGIADGFPEKQSGTADPIPETVRYSGPPLKEDAEVKYKKGEALSPQSISPPPSQPLAHELIKRLSLTADPLLAKTIARAIEAQASYQETDLSAAAQFIGDWCKTARQCGVPIRQSTFRDSEWRNGNGRRKPQAAEMGTQVKRAVNNTDAVRSVFGTEMEPVNRRNGAGHETRSHQTSAPTLEGKTKDIR